MKKIKTNWMFALLLVISAVYMGVYIYKTSFISAGTRYFVLFDDAMISMRYAKNLAEGHGLVWNPGGTPVEGYTNPLWVVFMAFFHLFPSPLPKSAWRSKSAEPFSCCSISISSNESPKRSLTTP